MALTDAQDFKHTNEDEMNKISSQDEKVPEKENIEKLDDFFDGDIDLSATRKKRFRINGDNNTYIELDTSDMGIITRLENLYPKLQELSQDAAVKKLESKETEDERRLTKISQALTKIDVSMRNILDEIFDADVSAKCAPSGTMVDPFNGEFRFEHIIDVLSKLYTNNINAEYKKMAEKMKKHTSKYTKGK